VSVRDRAHGRAHDEQVREPEPVIEAPNGRPALSLSEAARAAGVSRSTIRRKHEDGCFPGSFKDRTGSWRVPHDDLMVAGLIARTSAPEDAAQPRSASPLTPSLTTVGDPARDPAQVAQEDAHAAQAEISRLKAELAQNAVEIAQEKTLRLVAEAKADERAAALADLRKAWEESRSYVRAITAGQASVAHVAPTAVPPATSPAPAHRWWRRQPAANISRRTVAD